MHKRIGFMSFVAVALSGCAAPVAQDEAVEEEPVASQAEALNFQPDFRVGVMAVKGSRSSTTGWTQNLGSGPSLSPVTLFTNGALDPDGPMIGLLNYAPGTLPTMATDFRVTLRAWYLQSASSLDGVSVIATTQWASEGNDLSKVTQAQLQDTWLPDRFQVGIETRPWPSGVQKTLVDFRIAARVCVNIPLFPGCSNGVNGRVTSWMSQIPAQNSSSWTPTILIPSVNSHGWGITLSLWLDTKLQ